MVDVIGRWLPLGLVYLAGSARLAGLEAEIYDARSKDHGYPEIEQHFYQSNATYIASTAITASINDAVRTLDLAKRVNPQVVTILGGVHPTLCYEEVLASTSAVDYIICGEGEETLKELLQSLENGAPLDDIPGLAFRRNGMVVKTSKRYIAAALDDLPTAWDLLEWEDYQYFVLHNARMGAISTSRAGDSDGATCNRHGLESNRRFRDPHKVVAEIVHLHGTYAVDVFLITDERPASNRERWELFLDLLIELNLPIFFLMQTCSYDIIRDRDIVWKYRKSGIVHIYVDMENDSKEPLELNMNGQMVPEGKLALDIIRNHGIISEASFVLGGPDETEMGVEHTLKLARYYNPDNVQFLPLTPWPNDNRFDDIRQYIRVSDYSKYNLHDPVIEPKGMSLAQVEDAIMDCSRKFYMGKMIEIITLKDTFKRDYLLKAMKLMMASPFILKKFGLGSLGKIPAKIGAVMKKDIF